MTAARRNLCSFCVTLTVTLLGAWASPAVAATRVANPHYGEVLFHFYQQDYFTALNRLQTSRKFERLAAHEEEARLLEGGLLLSWGQHDQAAEIFAGLADASEDESVVARASFYLAKVRYQRGYLTEAEKGFLALDEGLSVRLAAERINLLAAIYLAQERYDDAAQILTDWQGPQGWLAYARFNLGVALMGAGDFAAGAAVLDELGKLEVASDEQLAMRDRANLALGFAYLRQEQPAEAQQYLRRVSLRGPYANKALLGAGWAASADEDYMRALGPWQELGRREMLDSAVQESLLAVPYAYAQLDYAPQAADAYANALGIFDAEINRIDAAIDAAADDDLIPALLAENSRTMGGWNWKLVNLSGDERSHYLYFSIADHRFHEVLRSYRGLVAIDDHLQQWEQKLLAWEPMLAERARVYKERWPELQARIESFDLAAMQHDFDAVAEGSQRITAERDVAAAAPVDQQAQWQQLQTIGETLDEDAADEAGLKDRQRILEGLLLWDLEREFRVRDWRRSRSVNELGRELDTVNERAARLAAEADAMPARLQAFEQRVRAARAQVAQARAELDGSLLAHTDYLNGIAVAELQTHRDRLVAYRAQARFALAAIYDRMSASNR